MVEFDHFIPELLLNEGARKRENGVSLAFIMTLMIVVLLSAVNHRCIMNFTIFK